MHLFFFNLFQVFCKRHSFLLAFVSHGQWKGKGFASDRNQHRAQGLPGTGHQAERLAWDWPPGAGADTKEQPFNYAKHRTEKIPYLSPQIIQKSLTNYDLSEILNLGDSLIGQLLANHERQTKTLIPRRGTVHDAGGGLSHKWIICRKRYVEGKSPDQIARETYHSIEAVDRYLGQFDRVRHCHNQGLSPIETAHILNCSVSLVKAYRQIDQELEGKEA